MQAASVQHALKRAQSGSAAGSGRKRGAAVEAMQAQSGSGAAADSKWTQAASSSCMKRTQSGEKAHLLLTYLLAS